MSRLSFLALIIGSMALLSGAADAAEWGAIVPGKSTAESVHAQYGEPTQRNALKVEGYDTTEWVYEGDRAPGGTRRLAVEFGLLTPSGYRPELVRVLRLEPTPGVFTRRTVELGWGPPTGIGREGDAPVFFYQEGLVVLFDKDGWIAERMIFTLPQPPARE